MEPPSPVIRETLIKKSAMIKKNPLMINTVYKIDKNKVLGTGAFGVVYRVQHIRSKQIRACKIIPWDKIENKGKFAEEIKILQMLDHPNVLKLYEYFEDTKNVYLITEIYKGGELYDLIVDKEYLNEKEACVIFKQIVQSIYHCHKLEIVHRDLKPENFILVDKYDENVQIKTVDFGFAKLCQHNGGLGSIERMDTFVGSAYYMSPDVISGSYDKSCDLWSAGCILYIMLAGYPPFSGKDDQDVLKKVQKANLIFDKLDWADVSEDAIDLIK